MAPKAPRKRKLSLVDDSYDDDVAGPPKKAPRVTGSASTSTSRTTRGVLEAKKEICRMGDDLVKFLEKQGEGAGTGHHQLSLAETLPELSGLRLEKGIQSQDVVYEKARECITFFQKMITDYETSNAKDNGIQKPTGLRWKQDTEDLLELERKATAISMRVLGGSLLARTHAKDLAPPSGQDDDIEMVAWEMLAEGIPKSVEETWGAAAQDMLEAFSGVVKLLPAERRKL